MKRREIKNLNDFINIGCCKIIYSDYKNEVIDLLIIEENISCYLLDHNFMIRWFVNDYITLGVYNTMHQLKCYITFFDDYVSIDLNIDLLRYDLRNAKVLFSLFDEYYYYD